MLRKVKQTVSGQTQYDGAGVKLVRVIGKTNVKDFDPFLMLDAFDSSNPEDYIKGFPWHPHRGIETVTYLISGLIEHGDSLGNEGVIENGCCQWMTAGSGIIHQEMPQTAERMLGVQLWLNLAASDKMTAPAYRDIRADMVPWVKEDGLSVGIISGDYKNTAGAVQGDYVKARFLDVVIDSGAEFDLSIPDEENVFAYIISGSGWFGGEANDLQQNKSALLFGEGDQFTARSDRDGLRFLLFSGKPLREPVAWGGPIVMNTHEELELAFQEIRSGTFIRQQGSAGTL